MAWMLEGEWIHLWLSSSDLFLKGGRGSSGGALFCIVLSLEKNRCCLGTTGLSLSFIIFHYPLKTRRWAM